MKALAKIIKEETNEVVIACAEQAEYFPDFQEMDVEQAYNGSWYVKGYAPEKPLSTDEEQRQNRANAYREEIDPITAHISRLKDEEQTAEFVSEIEQLKAERSAKVREIKERFPYMENEQVENNSENDII